MSRVSCSIPIIFFLILENIFMITIIILKGISLRTLSYIIQKKLLLYRIGVNSGILKELSFNWCKVILRYWFWYTLTSPLIIFEIRHIIKIIYQDKCLSTF